MAKEYYDAIADELCIKNEAVELGKMMSCPGVTYKGKVFCFFYKDE